MIFCIGHKVFNFFELKDMINRLNYAPKLLHGLAHFGPIILIFEFLLIFSKKIYRFLVPIHPSGHYIVEIHEKDTFLE